MWAFVAKPMILKAFGRATALVDRKFGRYIRGILAPKQDAGPPDTAMEIKRAQTDIDPYYDNPLPGVMNWELDLQTAAAQQSASPRDFNACRPAGERCPGRKS